MPSDGKKQIHNRTILGRIGRITLWVLASLIGLIIIVVLLLQTAFVQDYIRGKAVNWLSSKLNTKVAISKLRVRFPVSLELGGVYIEDRSKDTLFSAGVVRADLDMWSLFHGEYKADLIRIASLTANLKRSLPDTQFNFQFIIDAFASPHDASVKKEKSKPFEFRLGELRLDSIRLVYDDIKTGNLFVTDLVSARIRKIFINPDSMDYRAPDLEIDGMWASYRQQKPLVTVRPDETIVAANDHTIPLKLGLKNISLGDIHWYFLAADDAIENKIELNKFQADIDQVDLTGHRILMNRILMDSSDIVLRLGKSIEAPQKSAKENKEDSTTSWVFISKEILLNKNNIKFDDDNATRSAAGMDYMHIDAKKFSLFVRNFIYSNDSVSGTIDSAAMSEKSGFILNALHGDFVYTSQQAYIKNLLLETPGTTIQQSISGSWPSIDALKKDPPVLQLNLDLRDTKIQVKDILTFVPDLRKQKIFSNPNSVLYVDATVNGSLARLNLPVVRIGGIGSTSIDLSGTVAMASQPEKMNVDLTIRNLKTTRTDLENILPAGSIPENISLPQSIALSGKIKGGLNNIFTDLSLRSDFGNATVKGTLKNIRDSVRAIYDLKVQTRQLEIGRILKQDSLLGHISADISVKGTGYTPEKMNAAVNGKISSVELKNYDYRNLALDAKIENKIFEATASSLDPNFVFSLTAGGVLEDQIKFRADIHVDTLNAYAVRLTSSPLIYKGSLHADFENINPDSLEGYLDLTDTYLKTDSMVVMLDTMQVSAGFTDTGQFVRVMSKLLNAELSGKYKLTEMGGVLAATVNPYFRISDDTAKAIAPFDFRLNAKLVDHPLLHSFAPSLQRLDTVTLLSAFHSDRPSEINFRIPNLIYDSVIVNEFNLNTKGSGDTMVINTTLKQLNIGEIQMFQTQARMQVFNNKIHSYFKTSDRAGKERYLFGTEFAIRDKDTFAFSIFPEPLLLNYEKWYMNAGNEILIGKKGLNVNKFILSQGNEELSINTLSDSLNGPVEVGFYKFKIGTIVGFIQQDTMTVDGEITGKATLENLLKEPVFVSDLKIENLSFSNDTLGTLAVKVSSKVTNRYDADIRLSEKGNDIVVTGSYTVSPDAPGRIDMNADFKAIQLNTLGGVTQGLVRDASGYINGNLNVQGTLDNPAVRGALVFRQTRFNLGLLNSYFSITDQNLNFTEEGVKFDKFTINDSAGNKAVINGMAYTKNFRDYRFDLALRANDFKALNTTRKHNDLYHGQVNFDANLKVKGTQAAPVVDGTIGINKNTSLTVILPSEKTGVEEREGIVRFVDMDSIAVDTSLVIADTLNTSEISGMEVNLNIVVDKDAVFTLVIDEGNGDFLRMKGEGQLSGGISPGGEIALSGSYEIKEGTYEMTFNFLKRKFDIVEGSKITWKGQPTEADVDITAKFKVDTSPLDLVENQLGPTDATVINTYRQRLPFEVDLFMKNKLMQPDISFDIRLPESDRITVGKEVVQTVQDKLTIIRQEPSEMNKQVFALLLLKRFIGESPFQSSAGGFSAESFARTSVSKIFTDELNDLAASLIKGVDVNFDVESSEDFTTGKRQNRTDLNVNLSKRLLNDRLTVSVGSNFELEGVQGSNQRSTNLAGNISIDYLLSQDGRYKIRGYRKNTYEGILEGYMIETGIGFVITVDYNRFKEVFISKKAREKRRVERRKQRQEKKEVTAG